MLCGAELLSHNLVVSVFCQLDSTTIFVVTSISLYQQETYPAILLGFYIIRSDVKTRSYSCLFPDVLYMYYVQYDVFVCKCSFCKKSV